MAEIEYQLSEELQLKFLSEFIDSEHSEEYDSFPLYISLRFKCKYHSFRKTLVFKDQKHLNWFLLQI